MIINNIFSFRIPLWTRKKSKKLFLILALPGFEPGYPDQIYTFILLLSLWFNPLSHWDLLMEWREYEVIVAVLLKVFLHYFHLVLVLWHFLEKNINRLQN